MALFRALHIYIIYKRDKKYTLQFCLLNSNWRIQNNERVLIPDYSLQLYAEAASLVLQHFPAS